MRCKATPILAAVDCGTNTTRLLIVSNGVDVVREARITRLGQGVDGHGQLEPEAIRRTLEVLTRFRSEMAKHAVEAVRVVATSAVRDASNRWDFIEPASRILGCPVELLSGEEEGALALVGALKKLPPIEGQDIVVDIGGGSTEIAVRHGEATNVVSTNLGCVRLTERYLLSDPPRTEEISAATSTIRRELHQSIPITTFGSERIRERRMTGLAGTISTLAMLILGSDHPTKDKVQHSNLLFADVKKWSAILLSESIQQRSERGEFLAGRADIIAAGALILREVMDRLRVPACLASETDLLDGLVHGLSSTVDLE